MSNEAKDVARKMAIGDVASSLRTAYEQLDYASRIVTRFELGINNEMTRILADLEVARKSIHYLQEWHCTKDSEFVR